MALAKPRPAERLQKPRTDLRQPSRRPPRGNRALILAGSGRFSDREHDFHATSDQIAGILSDDGFACEITTDVAGHLADLSGNDLVVINFGQPATADLALDAHIHHGLLEYLGAGGGLLAFHCASSTMPMVPEWEDILGALWVRHTTDRTGYGTWRILVYEERHPIVHGIPDFTIVDDLYTYLRVQDDVLPLATHIHDGIEHPVLWARNYGPSRVVYDALGHGTESFDNPEHREILRRSARWLIDIPV